MHDLSLKLAVISALGLASLNSHAVGFVSLPTTGFSVVGGSSAYTICNPTGNFGSSFSINPTSTANNNCAVFPGTEASPPENGFSIIASAARPAVMNNSYTGFTDKTVATVTEYVWRKQTGTSYECIYGSKIVLNSSDYNSSIAGTQSFEVNDLARGGFSGLPVSIAYASISNTAQPVFRAGRSYTAVQHRATGYLAQPLTGLSSAPSINGLDTSFGTATALQQLADIDANWVDFTTHATFIDSSGVTSAASPLMYVKTTCSAAAPSTNVHDEAIRIRQTSQEAGTPFIEIKVRGFVPPSGSISPAHTDPY